MRQLRLYRYGRFEDSKPTMGLTLINGVYKADILSLSKNKGKVYNIYIASCDDSLYFVDAEKNEIVLKNSWKLGESYGMSDCVYGDNFRIHTELTLDSGKIKITTYTYDDFANLVFGVSENCETIEEAKHYLEEHGLHNSLDSPNLYLSAPVYLDFIWLNVHSHYSIMKSQITIPTAVDKAVADGMKGMALTDLGVMYGIKEFVDYCAKINKKRAKEGLEPFKPIIGCEMYVAPRTMHDKEKGDEKCGRLIVLAKNLTGYKNLCKLVSNSWTEGLMDETPRTDHAELEKYKEGLIVIVSGNNSEIANYAIAGDMGKALSVGEWYKNTFGNDFYLGIKRNETLFKSESLRPHDIEEVRSAYVKIDNEYNIKSVCVNSCNYLNEEDGVVLDHLLAIANNKTLDDSSCPHHVEGEWMKTREELTELFRGKSDARINSLELFDKIEFYSIDNASLLPKVQFPECKNMGIAISLPEINIEKARRECVKVCRDEHDIIFGLKKCENGYIAQKIQDEEEYEFYITNVGFLTTAGYDVCILDSYLIDPLYANGWNYHLSYNWGCVTFEGYSYRVSLQKNGEEIRFSISEDSSTSADLDFHSLFGSLMVSIVKQCETIDDIEQILTDRKFPLGYYNKSLEWYKQEAEAGNTEVQILLANMYSRGDNVRKDSCKAFEWYSKAAQAGSIEAQKFLGDCYANGDGVEPDIQKAIEWYTKVAESGYKDVALKIANMHLQMSISMYEKAAEAGLEDAQEFLADYYFKTKAYAKAGALYKKLNTNGKFNTVIGNCYYELECYPEAVKYFDIGAKKRDVDALVALGKCYYLVSAELIFCRDQRFADDTHQRGD